MCDFTAVFHQSSPVTPGRGRGSYGWGHGALGTRLAEGWNDGEDGERVVSSQRSQTHRQAATIDGASGGSSSRQAQRWAVRTLLGAKCCRSVCSGRCHLCGG